jgi:hypothetical protein
MKGGFEAVLEWSPLSAAGVDLSVLRKTDLSRRGRSDTIGCLPANLGS